MRRSKRQIVSWPDSITVGVAVADQVIADGKVAGAAVFSGGPAWIVIRAQAGAKAGSILGYGDHGVLAGSSTSRRM